MEGSESEKKKLKLKKFYERIHENIFKKKVKGNITK